MAPSQTRCKLLITNMKILMYILTFLFGLWGVLGVFRSIELLMAGQFKPATALIAIVMLILAFACLKKARKS